MPILRDSKNEEESKIFSILNDIDSLSHGYGIIPFVVGGFCREEILGHPHKLSDDCDMMAEGYHGLYLAGIIGSHFGVPVEYRHRTGTAKLSIEGLDFDFKSNMKEPDILAEIRNLDKPQNAFTLDIFSRDFTINTIAMSLRSGKLYDHTGLGIQDLKKGIIRTPLDPNVTLRVDSMLVLRAIDFAVRYGFDIVPELRASMMKYRTNITKQLPEDTIASMIHDKILKHSPDRGLALLKEFGLEGFVELKPE